MKLISFDGGVYRARTAPRLRSLGPEPLWSFDQKALIADARGVSAELPSQFQGR